MGKKSTKTTTDTSPWAPLQPHILGAAGTIQNTVNGNQGNLNNIAGDIRGHLPQLGDMAFGQQPGLAAAQGYATDVLGGKYLGAGNPYLEGMIGQTRNNVANQVNSSFSMAGRTGGGNNVERLGQGLANAENQLRYQDYSSERDRMAQAGALLPSLTAAQYAGIQPYLAASETAGQLPYAGINYLAPILGSAAGAGKTTGTQPGGWGNDLLNAGAAIGSALIMGSDRRMKKDIVKVGEMDDGLGVYEWTYRHDPDGARYRGVMADEVKELRPLAYIANWNGSGFDAVNYGAL